MCDFLLICCINLSTGKIMKLTSSLLSSVCTSLSNVVLVLFVFPVFNQNPLFAIYVTSNLIILIITIAVAVSSCTVLTFCCGLALSRPFLLPPVLASHPTHLYHAFGHSLLFTKFLYSVWSWYNCKRLVWISLRNLLPLSSMRSQWAPSMLVTVKGPIHLRFNALLWV